MKIKIDDGMQLAVGTGIGKYTAHLAASLSETAVPEDGDTVEILTFDKGGKRSLRRLKYLWHIQSPAYRKKTRDADVVHFTNYAIPVRRSRDVVYAVTVHDLVAFLYPETLPRFYRFYARAVTRYAIKHADLIFTVSGSVKAEIASLFPEAADKTVAIYPGVYDEMSARQENGGTFVNAELQKIGDAPFFLAVGTVEKRKNPGMLIRVFDALKAEGKLPGYKLIFAGRDGYGAEEFHKQAENAASRADIIFTGYIENGDCNLLYDRATACVFPTFYEGFGSTQLECMAHGVRLVLSDIPTNREVSDGYGKFFSLANDETLATALLAACQPERAEARAERVAAAEEFLAALDWKRVAPLYRSVYDRTVENRKHP